MPYRKLSIGFAGATAMSCLTGAVALAAYPPVERLMDSPVTNVMEVVNGTVASAQVEGEVVWRWRPQVGQTSILAIRRDHPLLDRLCYYDRFDLDFRIAGGEIEEIGLEALGHVSGPRRYKIHQWNLAIRTTATGEWHARPLELARPNWFPWDNADGQDAGIVFRLSAIALTPEAVIELRRMRFIQPSLYLKPDYELPVTWPVATNLPDGQTLYRLQYQVLNIGDRPQAITARILSRHSRFRVTLEPESTELKVGQAGTFILTGAIGKADIEATPELYTEPLRLSFAAAAQPEAECRWTGYLPRPLSDGLRSQLLWTEADLKTVRARLETNDIVLQKALGYDNIMQTVDELCAKRLESMPRSHHHTGSEIPLVPDATPSRRLAPGAFMPEAVDPKGPFREVGTDLAGVVWKEYLGEAGHAAERLGLAYLFTADETYARKGIELLLIYARQFSEQDWVNLFDPRWNRGPNILGSSRIGSSCTYAGSMLMKGMCRLASALSESPSWTAETRQRVYAGLVLPYATETVKFNGSLNNMTDIANHNMLLLGAAFRDAALVRWALQSDSGLLSRLRDIDPDGFSAEGRPINYHLAAMAEYLPAVAYVNALGLKAEFPRERLLAAVRMPYLRATLTGFVPATGDCGRGGILRRNPLADSLIPLFPKDEWLFAIGASPLRAVLGNKPPAGDGLEKYFESEPRLFPAAGFAILRTGVRPEEQIMVTLDYGRNLFHAALDRNQITLCAFGKVFTQGPGSLYNAGQGGIIRNPDPRLTSFISHASLAQNVVMVDRADQLPAIGQLLAWSANRERQVAVSRVAGIRPGVAHTRGVALTEGVVILCDRLQGDAEHTYDFVYHNFGALTPGAGWTASPAATPLGTSVSYENIGALQALSGAGPLQLTWDLTGQTNVVPPLAALSGNAATIKLAFWQLPVAGGKIYTGNTGLNNPNTHVVPDVAPSVFHRVTGKAVEFYTVLEPYRDAGRVRRIDPVAGGVKVTLRDGRTFEVVLDQLIKQHAVKSPSAGYPRRLMNGSAAERPFVFDGNVPQAGGSLSSSAARRHARKG